MKILHPVKSLDTVMPAYAKSFSCVGPSCSDTCCAGWTVTIDRKTHQCYQKVVHPSLTPTLKKVLHRTRNQDSTANYSRVEMSGETGDCPLMTEKLCSVQTNLGEDKLSDTCFSYPRETLELAGVRQQSLTLSCPEAARLALSGPEAMNFIRSHVMVRPSTIHTTAIRGGLSIEAVNRVRFFAIQLIQSDRTPLWERLANLGFMCELVDTMALSGQQGRVIEALGHLDLAVKSGESSKALADLLPDHAAQAIMFAKLWAARRSLRYTPSQQRVRDQVINGLGFDSTGHASNETVIACYREGLEFLLEVHQSIPWALPNYVMNEMFREAFPFGGRNALHHYTQLIVRYGMVRLMLAAQSRSANRSLSLSEVTETIQAFARTYQHNTQFAQGVDEGLRAMKWDTLDKTYRFLRE